MSKHVQTQTEWEEEMSGKILEYVRDALYLDLRFFQGALWELQPKAEERLKTMATDGENLFFCAEQLLRLFKKNDSYLNRLYLHVVCHCLFQHLWIGGNRDRWRWQIACDIVVEYVIDSMKKPSTQRIIGWLRQKTYEEIEQIEEGVSAATVYRCLLEKEPQECEKLYMEFMADDHVFWPQEEKKQAVQQRGSARKKWSQISKQMQLSKKKEESGEEEICQRMQASLQYARKRRSYQDFLKKFTVFREEKHLDPEEFDMNFYSYGLRMYGNMPLIEPLETREVRKIQDFVIAIDTSYSTSGQLVQNFLQETFDILSRQNTFFHRSRIYVIQCDEKIQKEEMIDSQEAIQKLFSEFEICGGGNTDFRPVFTRVQELQAQGVFEHLCGLLYFTDGNGIYPQKKPDYKTAFLFLNAFDEEKVPAWAIRMRLEKEEFLQKKDRNM